MRLFAYKACTVMLLVALVGTGVATTVFSEGFADSAFENVWQTSDKPVAQGATSRTWMWGPAPFATKNERYEESYGTRLVQYFDKSRMEITKPYASKNDPWYVTNGLLVKELISGQIQVGDALFVSYRPADIPVAGDLDNPWPTYAGLGSLIGVPAPNATGQFVTGLFLQDGPGTYAQGANDPNAQLVSYEGTLGHNIPRAFWDFLNSTGLVSHDGQYVTGKLFDPTFYATGLPLTEPYWAQVKVNNVMKPVLFQAFERRVLTYTPDNPEGWKVEMGNVGQHYFNWRYESSYNVGDVYQMNNPLALYPNPWEIKVLGVEKTQKIVGTSSYGSPPQATATGVFIVVRANVKNLGLKQQYITTYDFVVRDSQGREFTMGELDAQWAAESKYGLKGVYTEVQPSLTDEEVYVFDVAPDATGLRFTPSKVEQPAVSLGV